MRLSGFSLPVEHFSASSLAKAIMCPELWRRRYILREREGMFSGRFMGMVDHETHADNFRQKVETGQDLDVAWMRGKYEARWNLLLQKEEPNWNDDDPAVLQERGMLAMEAYHTAVSPFVLPMEVEERFEEMLPGVPRPMVGYIDVKETSQIIERKTSNRKVSSLKPDWRFQGRIYQMVADLPTSFHVVTTQVTPQILTPESDPGLFLAKGNPDTILLMVQQTVRRINDLWERYGPDSPWPTEGLFHPFACNFCQFKETGCPAWKVP